MGCTSSKTISPPPLGPPQPPNVVTARTNGPHAAVIQATPTPAPLSTVPTTLSEPSAENPATQLLRLVKAGNHEQVRKEIESHPSLVNARGMWESTPLLYACQYAHADIAICLLEAGADVSLLNEKKVSSLLLASLEGLASVVKRIVASKQLPILHWQLRGVVYNSFTDSNQSLAPLDAAATNGHIECVQVLLDGASPDVRKAIIHDKPQPLMAAARHGHLPIATMLLECGADLTAIDDEGNNAIFTAVQGGHDSCALKLLQASPSMVSTTNNAKMSLLHIAALTGCIELAKYILLTESSLIDSENSKQETPSHVATYRSQWKFLELLLDAGANVDIKDATGKTSREILIRKKKTQLIVKLPPLPTENGPRIDHIIIANPPEFGPSVEIVKDQVSTAEAASERISPTMELVSHSQLPPHRSSRKIADETTATNDHTRKRSEKISTKRKAGHRSNKVVAPHCSENSQVDLSHRDSRRQKSIENESCDPTTLHRADGIVDTKLDREGPITQASARLQALSDATNNSCSLHTSNSCKLVEVTGAKKHSSSTLTLLEVKRSGGPRNTSPLIAFDLHLPVDKSPERRKSSHRNRREGSHDSGAISQEESVSTTVAPQEDANGVSKALAQDATTKHMQQLPDCKDVLPTEPSRNASSKELRVSLTEVLSDPSSSSREAKMLPLSTIQVADELMNKDTSKVLQEVKASSMENRVVTKERDALTSREAVENIKGFSTLERKSSASSERQRTARRVDQSRLLNGGSLKIGKRTNSSRHYLSSGTIPTATLDQLDRILPIKPTTSDVTISQPIPTQPRRSISMSSFHGSKSRNDISSRRFTTIVSSSKERRNEH